MQNKNDEMTDAELDRYFADLCEEIAAMSASSDYDLIGRVRGKFAEDLTYKT